MSGSFSWKDSFHQCAAPEACPSNDAASNGALERLGCIYQIPRLEKKTVQAVTKFYILLMTDKDQTERGPENESTLPKFERLQLGKTPEFKEPAMPGFPSFLAGEALDIFLEGSNQLNCVTVWIGQC